MTEVQDYPSRLNDAESKRFEAFSYLPPMDASQIRKQVEYAVSKGWNCAIEHAEPERAGKSYWYMWKLPMFGEKVSISSCAKPRPATAPTRATTCGSSVTTTKHNRKACRWSSIAPRRA